jgi:hypothetical protein
LYFADADALLYGADDQPDSDSGRVRWHATAAKKCDEGDDLIVNAEMTDRIYGVS